MTGFERFTAYQTAGLVKRDQTADGQAAIRRPAKAGHNLGHNNAESACKLLIPLSTFVDSQSSNPGSIPGSATNSFHCT